MATKSKPLSATWPKVAVGSHLTVYTYEDGSTKLEWDDAALLKEVQEALASVTPASKKSDKFNFSEPKKITTENGNEALEVRVTKKTKGEPNGKTSKTRKSK